MKRFCAALLLAALMPVFAQARSGRDFREADEAFLQREDFAKARSALAAYRETYRAAPDDPDAAWRLSMACYFVAFETGMGNAGKKKLYAEGRDAGLAAVKLSSSSAESHFWAAINMALYGETVGIFKMLFSLPAVIGHLKASIALDPSYAYGGAYRVLGAIAQALPRILGGSDEEARSYYEKALAVAPDEPMNHLFLARILNDRFREHEAARALLRRALALGPFPPDRYEARKALVEVRVFLATMDAEKERD